MGRNNNNNSVDFEKIARCLSGEMSNTEHADFVNQMRSNQVVKKTFGESEIIWELSRPDIPRFETDTDRGWDRLSGRIFQDFARPKNHKIKKLWFITRTRWAAAILLLLLTATFSIIKVFQPKYTEKTVIANAETTTRVKTLLDGSVIYIAPGSNISIPQRFDKDNRTLVLDGKGFFDVAHGADHPFVVKTNKGTIVALGTSFNVDTRHGKGLEVFVETGRVRVDINEPAQEGMILHSGELAILSENKLEKSIPIQGYFTGWRKNQIHFKDEYLHNILRTLNRNYGSKFMMADGALKDRRLTVTFYNNSIPTITELIRLSLNLEYEIKPDSSIVFRSKQ